MGTIKDFKYKKIKNFLSKEQISLLTHYCKMKHIVNKDNFDFVQSDVGDTRFYADPLMEALMMDKKKFLEQETGLELLPTYSFWRMYTKDGSLKRHFDRPSCEISVTVMIGSSGEPWPIYMDEKPIEMESGDAVIYLGCDIWHERKPFKGDWHAQSFMHYVDKNGPYADEVLDKRKFFCMPGVKDAV